MLFLKLQKCKISIRSVSYTHLNDKYNEHELEMSIIQMFEEKGYTYIQEKDVYKRQIYILA